MAVRFSTEEMARVDAAAAREGLVTATWLGEVGLAAADPDGPVPAGRASREELDAVVHATEVLRRVGCLLNQAVAAFRSTGTPPESLVRITDLAWRLVARLDDETLVFRRKRRQR